jgi:hypothetical protein
MKPQQLPLNILRGLCGTFLAAFGGAIAAAGVAFAFRLCRGLPAGATRWTPGFDLGWLEKDMVQPIVGCAAVFACAGWATFAPSGAHGLVRSILAIFLLSLPLWFAAWWFHLTPPRLKGIDYPVFSPTELLALVGPPTVASALLTAIRNRARAILPHR